MPEVKPITSIDDLEPDPRNANKHSQRGMGFMENSIRECGYGDSMTVDRNGRVISGNGRLEVLADIKMLDAIVVQSDGTRPIVHQRVDLDLEADPKAVRLGILQNRVGEVNLEWDAEVLAELAQEGVELDDLWSEDELTALLADVAGASLGSDSPLDLSVRPTLADRFGVPPFSVLDARQGYWQDRKRQWVALGIKSELGRGGGLTMSAEQVTTENLNYYRNRNGQRPAAAPGPHVTTASGSAVTVTGGR